MNKTDMMDQPDPWRVPVPVTQIPDTGLHRDITANDAACQAIADVAGVRAVLSAQASFDVTPKSGGRFQVEGRVRARIGQVCVVTLEDIENDIDETIDLTLAPPDQIPQMADLVAAAEASGEETPDPPEPLAGDTIDLGRLATDALLLAIDPYPRKPGAVFEGGVEAPDPEDHPFAALKALKVDTKPSIGRKPKGK